MFNRENAIGFLLLGLWLSEAEFIAWGWRGSGPAMR